MKPIRHLFIVVCWFLIVPSVISADEWKAGVARVKVTPAESMWMAGYAARTQPAAETHGDLWAKTLVLEDPDGRQGVLIALDLIGIDRRFSRSFCDLMQERFSLRRDQIAICCSHTHTGPVVGKCLEPLHYRQLDARHQTLIDRYEKRLMAAVADCVASALEDLQPARLSWGSALATFAVNRRHNTEEDVLPRRSTGTLVGPVDHDVPVLAVRSVSGQLRAVVFGYACHATTLNDYGWSGDYPGFAAAELESRFEGCTALFWAGCGADQNPLPRRRLELAQQYGHQLADSVAVVLQGLMQPISGRLQVAYREIPLALDHLPSVEQLQQTVKSSNRYERARAAMLLEEFDRDGQLAQTYPYPVARWELGDTIEMIFLGGEVVVELAIRLKSERRGRRTWVAAYSNDVMAYIPSERVLREGGYEGGGAMVYYGLPGPWAPGVEAAIVHAVDR